MSGVAIAEIIQEVKIESLYVSKASSFAVFDFVVLIGIVFSENFE